MLTHSAIAGDLKFFNYRVDFATENTTRIEWPADDNVAVLDHEVVVALVRRGYGRTVTRDEAATIELQEGANIVTPAGDEKITNDLGVPSQPQAPENGATPTRGTATETRGMQRPTDATKTQPGPRVSLADVEAVKAGIATKTAAPKPKAASKRGGTKKA